jgi:ADP-ribose pyrophosphatase YjhB (NUDIX family)
VSKEDRRYPDRPIVGVGAVVLVGADCRIDGIPASRPVPYGVVLVKRRFAPLAGHWSLPGGALEVGETLEAGVAREILEETGLIVDVGVVIEVFDRIMYDDEAADADSSSGARVLHHYVLIDYLCRPAGGRLEAGSDVSEVAIADPCGLARFGVTAKVESVVARAMDLK